MRSIIHFYSLFRFEKNVNNLELWLSSSNQGIAIGAEVFCFFECLHTAWDARAADTSENNTRKLFCLKENSIFKYFLRYLPTKEEYDTSDPSINAGFTFHFRRHFLRAERTDHPNRFSAKSRLGNWGTIVNFDFIEFKFRHLRFLDFDLLQTFSPDRLLKIL